MINNFKTKDIFKNAFENRLKDMFNKSVSEVNQYEQYSALATLLDEEFVKDYNETNKKVVSNNLKKTIYFSMEFLMGRLITSNLMNSGYASVVKEAFDDYGFDLNEIEHVESDAGLGNGGLGRLAACFLDSSASLGLPLYGNSLRYKKGFFTQDIVDDKQVEYPDNWLDTPFYWEERRDDLAVDIPFYGYVKHTKLIDPVWVKAVPYDIKVIGADNNVVTHLRTWSTSKSDKQHYLDEDYYKMVNGIDRSLYPDDSKEEGKYLRLQQQYLFSSAGVISAFNEHEALGRDLKDFHKYYTFQINDTHPTLVIPEMMRILMDNEGLSWDDAWHITTNTVAYTNHTILQEALEKWDKTILRSLLPRIYEILVEMNKRFITLLDNSGVEVSNKYLMHLIGDTKVRMANISIYGSFSVNGVAALHTEILKQYELNDFYRLFPEKFNNKTNGITHRRWLLHINHQLTDVLDKYIGTSYKKDLRDLKKLEEFIKDDNLKKLIYEMKLAKKKELVKVIEEREGIQLDENSIFDIQIKRLHEYKRQLLNILHVIYLYLRLKKDAEFKKNFHPQTFIFGAKAAPSYVMAKGIIELINKASKVINNDKDTNHLIKSLFVTNYNVTYAEYLFPAADLSEQISTASKEASGTGNMKFMVNGALTIGTLDGANVEIVEHAGIENAFIFGLKADEVNEIYKYNNYKPRLIYENDQRLKDVFEFIKTLDSNPYHFDFILHNLLTSDYFLVLKDFDAYVKAQELANKTYKDFNKWFEMVIMNIANSGFFSSDRTILDYNKDIWHLEKID